MPVQNPLTAPLSIVKSFGEQGNLTLQNVQTSFTQAFSQGIDSLMAAVPALPGSTPGGESQAVTPQSLIPSNLKGVLSQAENILFPAGLMKPSSMVAQTQTVQNQTQSPALQNQAPAAQKGTTGGGYVKVLRRRGI